MFTEFFIIATRGVVRKKLADKELITSMRGEKKIILSGAPRKIFHSEKLNQNLE